MRKGLSICFSNGFWEYSYFLYSIKFVLENYFSYWLWTSFSVCYAGFNVQNGVFEFSVLLAAMLCDNNKSRKVSASAGRTTLKARNYGGFKGVPAKPHKIKITYKLYLYKYLCLYIWIIFEKHQKWKMVKKGKYCYNRLSFIELCKYSQKLMFSCLFL